MTLTLGLQMYARITNFHVYESKLVELERRLSDLCTRLQTIQGLVEAYSAWRDDGQGVSIAFYEDEDSADKAALEVQSMWASFDDLLSAPIQVATYEVVWEIRTGS